MSASHLIHLNSNTLSDHNKLIHWVCDTEMVGCADFGHVTVAWSCAGIKWQGFPQTGFPLPHAKSHPHFIVLCGMPYCTTAIRNVIVSFEWSQQFSDHDLKWRSLHRASQTLEYLSAVLRGTYNFVRYWRYSPMGDTEIWRFILSDFFCLYFSSLRPCY